MEAATVEPIDGELMEVVPIHQPPANLFRTDDPVLVVQRATEAANALRDVIRKQKLAVNIQGKWHVVIEGWQTCGAMLGITAVCEWTRPVEDGWEARVIAQTLDGRTVGAAEAQCLSTEKRGPWSKAEGYAIRSMAQTRASSKALASVLRFVVTLAGYEGTPAEEAEAVEAKPDEPQAVEAKLDTERVGELLASIDAARDEGMTFDQLALMMGACGIGAPEKRSIQSVASRVESLTPEQATALEVELAK